MKWFSLAFVVGLAPLSAQVEDWNVRLGSAVLMSVGGNSSPLGYTLVTGEAQFLSPSMLDWKTRGGVWTVRNRVDLLGGGFVDGPEHYVFSIFGSPMLEFRAASGSWVWHLSAGGGVGVLDAKGHEVQGGQGQDFTLTWFVESGMRFQIRENLEFSAALRFQHFSNGGMNDINPGMDLLGPTVGLMWKF